MMPEKVHCDGLFLGDTIQEKTRTLLSWSDEHCPTITVNTMNRYDRCMLRVNNSRRHPYMIPVERLRRYSTSSSNSTCSSSSSSSCSSSEYSQPSPSYSITSYESLSPEPSLPSPYTTTTTATDCQQSHLIPSTSVTKLSTASTASTKYRSPEREAQVFERLRQLVPMLPFDRNAYQILIETVSQVMDLEQQLEQLNEQTNSAKNSLWIGQRSFITDMENNHRDLLVFTAVHNLNLMIFFHNLPRVIGTSFKSVFPDDLKTVDVTAFKLLLSSNNSLLGDTSSRTMHFNFVS